MDTRGKLISFYTMVRKDVVRMFRIWPQTFLPSVVTSVMYFLIFGAFLGDKIGTVTNGVEYIAFVVPGLVMLAVVTNAYANVSFTFFTSKFFFRGINEILVSPTPPWVMIAGFVGGGLVRGIIIGTLVLLTSLFFTSIQVTHPIVVFLFFILTSLVFSLAGLVNGIYAKSIDGINIIPTFVLTPLVYLGGVFYPLSVLPGFWQNLTLFNPIFYLINGFRYGLIGVSDVPLQISLSVLFGMVVLLVGLNWYLIRKGLGLRQ